MQLRRPVHRHRLRTPAPFKGFTLIELMITVAILAIIAAVAFPSLMESIRKGRRSEAFAALAAVQQAQERLRTNAPAYTTTLSDTGVGSPTSGGYYDITLAETGITGDSLATGYVVTATGRSGTSQGEDSQCRKVSVQIRNGNLKYAGCGNCESFTYESNHQCWAR